MQRPLPTATTDEHPYPQQDLKPGIPAIERLQTSALDRAATGIAVILVTGAYILIADFLRVSTVYYVLSCQRCNKQSSFSGSFITHGLRAVDENLKILKYVSSLQDITL